MLADIQEKNVQKERLHNCLEQIMWVCRKEKKRQKVKEPEVVCKVNLNRIKGNNVDVWMEYESDEHKNRLDNMLFAVYLLCRVL